MGLRPQEETHNPETLPYYMNAVEQGYAGLEDRPQYGLEDGGPHIQPEGQGATHHERKIDTLLGGK